MINPENTGESKGMEIVKNDPNAGTSDPTDGRSELEWKSRYPIEAQKHIRVEWIYLCIILSVAYLLLFFTWTGKLGSFINIPPELGPVFKKYMYYSIAGMLGGVTFGIKYLYRVVPRGYWNLDRRIWRIMSPFISMTVAFVIGALVEASLMSSVPTGKAASGASIISIGFITGYFADPAVGKMYEIASVVFGKSAMKEYGHEKK